MQNQNTPTIVSTTQEFGLKENTVMIGVIDPGPRCWNSKSLPALKGSYSFLKKMSLKKKKKEKRKNSGKKISSERSLSTLINIPPK